MAQPRQLSADERRLLTVETVIDLAGRQNPADITTAAIADRMSVTQGALFRHFPSKDAIWEAVMQWVADRLLDRIDHAAEAATSPLNAMRAIFMSHVEFVIEHPGVPRMLFGELQRGAATPAKMVARMLVGRYAERLTQRLEEGKAAGEVDADADTRAAAMLFIGTIQGLVMQSLLGGNIEQMRVHAPAVLEIFIRGVEQRPRRRREGETRK